MNDWAVLDIASHKLRCERCGWSEVAPLLPMDALQFVDVMDGFVRRHNGCQPGDSNVDPTDAAIHGADV